MKAGKHPFRSGKSGKDAPVTHREQTGDAPVVKEAVIVAGAGTEMKIMSFNNEALAIFGSILKHGRPLLPGHFIQEKDNRRIKKVIQETLAHGKVSEHIRAEIVTESGESIPMLFSSSPLYSDYQAIQGIVLTFSRLDINESALRQRSGVKPDPMDAMQQQSLIEFLPEGVFTINTRCQIAFFNRAAENITGYKRQEVLGRYCWEVFHSDLCERGCPLKSALETGKGGEQQSVRIFTNAAVQRTILVNTEVLLDDFGSIVGAIETFKPLVKNPESVKKTTSSHSFSRIIGKSKAIRQLFKILPDIAACDANVFLTGESGTGKELFARTIHHNSPRARQPFMAVNCSALAETLLESELFGHEKFAFTGAVKSKPGRFELVKQGTLFLDEIGELKPGLQVKLLRVLEQREFERVGGTNPIRLEARIICATNRDLSRALENGSFRKDFYYRLRTVPMVIPPLRERKEDIPLLIDFFIHRFNVSFKKKVTGAAPEVLDLFLNYHWPGNVRELERTIEHAFVFVKESVILLENLPQIDLFKNKEARKQRDNSKIDLSKDEIIHALNRSGGKKKKAAALLGISRTSLWRKLKDLDLST